MTTKLTRLLEEIDPSKILCEVSSRVDAAVNRFAIREGSIADYNRFVQILSEFIRHIENEVLHLPSNFAPSTNDWTKCSSILEIEYGPQGHKTAFEMAKRGIHGGFYAVLKNIVQIIANKYAQNEISARIHHFWNALSMQQQFEVIEEYVEKYGRLLPPDYTEECAVLLKMNFTKVLEEHPRMVQRLRVASRF